MMEAVGVKPVLKKYEAGRKCPVDSRKPQPFVGTSWQVARDLFDQSPIQIRCQSHSKLVFVFLWRGEMLLFCYGDGLLNRNLYIKWCHYWMYFVFVIIKDAIMPLILTWEMVQKAQPPPPPPPVIASSFVIVGRFPNISSGDVMTKNNEHLNGGIHKKLDQSQVCWKEK